MDRIQDVLVAAAAVFAGAFGVLAQQISFVAQPFIASDTAEVLFVGDMMFDRSVRVAMDEKGEAWVFSCIKDDLMSADFVVGNLEGPITSKPSRSVGSKVGSPDNFVFTFPTYVAPTLERHNVRAVSLGNNHILNMGTSGVTETTKLLSDAGVGYFGEPGKLSAHDVDENGIAFTFIGFNLFDAKSTASTTASQIRDARTRGRHPIVVAHWGDEYVPANAQQKRLAKRFIDEGAEMVIGAHPHVIQDHEIYKNKHIYYSLGNFVFDQYWKDSVRIGLMVRVVFDENGVVSVEESKSYLERDRRTCPLKA
jgi:gamma-polyglutamate biosynthesis protein CapA